MSGAARRLGQGDLGAHTGLGHARDELGRLAQSFDDMARSLEAKDGQIVLTGRAVKVLSAWNQSLLAPGDEKALTEEMCRAIIEEGGLSRRLGVEEGYITAMKHTWADAEQGQRPIARALRSGKPEITRDVRSDPAFEPIRELAAKDISCRYRLHDSNQMTRANCELAAVHLAQAAWPSPLRRR